MKVFAALCALVCVNYINGHTWFKSSKYEKGHAKDGPKACYKPPFVGVCHPLNEAWYYDKRSNSCKMVQRGTCAGGNNLFPTMGRCMKACIPLTPNNSKICLQRPLVGTCAPVIVSWFYDEKSTHCKLFNHTICGGGGNAFLTEMKCQATCRPKKTPKPVCSLTPKPGRCLFARHRWYFDEKGNTCRVFSNQRCGSNDNGFSTQMKCLERCSYVKGTLPCPNCDQKIGNELPLATNPGQTHQNLSTPQTPYPSYRPHPIPPNTLPGAAPTLPGIQTVPSTTQTLG